VLDLRAGLDLEESQVIPYALWQTHAQSMTPI
jgi:hypothetical protein